MAIIISNILVTIAIELSPLLLKNLNSAIRSPYSCAALQLFTSMSRNSPNGSRPHRSHSAFVSPSRSKQDCGHGSSFRLKAVNVPVPPSLLQSPYLNSPLSPFQRSASLPCTPSQEDEQWLRDTIPLAAGPVRVGRSDSTKENSPSPKSQSEHTRGAEMMNKPHIPLENMPSSPPLVRTRRPPAQEKLQTPSMRHYPAGEQDYFLLARRK
ncbi:hypothetical protein GYMLUDRAFT_650206 [Collybiopsis luxurians FD-317 M1]|uniref:Uncharacterized protein n=1 Tax=Collybiopsis luxurians FD-317 M1 TaxID=944289 RepID=A0A0D0CAZ5_9AGAR|nr:hypothetical protein GYMLUDRAFT_650206 [Collybiopsis luxurians FD-317 M1]